MVIMPAIKNLMPAKRMVDGTLLTGISKADAVFIAGVALPHNAQQSNAKRATAMGVVNMFLSFFILFPFQSRLVLARRL